MAKVNTELLLDEFHKKFQYDPDTGAITRKVTSGRWKQGSEAGSLDSWGYRQIKVLGVSVLAHRLVWLVMTGVWCEREIDHIDRDKLNNSWSNLREVSTQANSQNKLSTWAKSGHRGVDKRGEKWRARIYTGSHTLSIGTYSTLEEARRAYLAAKSQHHQGFIDEIQRKEQSAHD